MSRIDDVISAEAVAVEEADPETPLPPGVTVTRGHPRSRNLQVRFRDDEFVALSAYAAEQGLPVSTVVRLLVLKALAPVDDLRSTLDRLESDLAAVRRSTLKT